METVSKGNDKKPTPNIVRLCGSSGSSCGYCQGKRSHLVNKTKDDSSKCYGLLVDQMSPQDYETLMNQGWRRSGLHLYKPDNWNSCCPALSIRLEVQSFQISKSQKRVLRSMDRCLQQTASQLNNTKPRHNQKGGRKLSRIEQIMQDSGVLAYLEQLTHQVLSLLPSLRQANGSSRENIHRSMCTFKFQKTKAKRQHAHTAVVFTTCCAAIAGRSKGRLKRDELSVEVVQSLKDRCSATRWPFSVRVENMEQHRESGHVLITLRVPEQEVSAGMKTGSTQTGEEMEGVSKQRPDILGDWLESLSHTQLKPPYRLTVATVPARESALQPEVYRLYALYQHKVHCDPDPFAQTRDSPRVLRTSNDDVDDDWDSPDVEKAKTILEREYGARYSEAQMKRIRKSYQCFHRFLVESPLDVFNSQDKNHSASSTTPPPTGTYHQHYRVQGKLIAVGVVDVLPRGLSSVYAFYDPALSKHLALGKFAILKEIEWTQQSRLTFYYLGYYIESCPKMTYKADYKPSALLCPTHYVWVDAAKAREVLQRDSPVRHCCTLYEGDKGKTKHHVRTRVETLRLDVGASSIVTLDTLNSHGRQVVRPLLEEFLAEIGPEVSRNCVIKLV